jgi:hypothetical protein
LGVGVEHLDATLRLLEGQVAAGGPILPLANFTVLRAALVGSCQAVTLLAAGSRQDRTTTGLQIAHEEFRQELNFREKTLAHAGLVEAARQAAESRDFLEGLRVRKADVARLLRARGAELKLTDTSMIERAAGLVYTSGDDSELMRLAVQMGWALGSGAAHGRLLMSMQRAGSFRDEAGGTMMFGATYEEIALEITSVSLVLNQGWRYWDLRRGSAG